MRSINGRFAQIAPVQPQQIEGDEMLRTTAPEQVVGPRLAISVEVNNFAVEHRGFDWQARCEPGADIAERFVRVAAPGDQANDAGLQIGESSKAVPHSSRKRLTLDHDLLQRDLSQTA